jgi:NAD(P) transhydrogenase
MFVMGGGILPETFPQWLAAASVLLANVNIFGGFIITKRMLDMFRRATDAPEYLYLYAIPGVTFAAAFAAAAMTGSDGLVAAGYLASSLLCISE